MVWKLINQKRVRKFIINHKRVGNGKITAVFVIDKSHVRGLVLDKSKLVWNLIKTKEDLLLETYRLYCKRLIREQMEINLV